MSYPRLIIPFANNFLTRYLVDTGMLDAFSTFSQPVVLLRQKNPELENRIAKAGAEVSFLPSYNIGNIYERIRYRLVLWHKLQRKLQTTKIEKQMHLARMGMSGKLNRHMRDILANLELHIPLRIKTIRRQEEAALQNDTNIQDFEKLLKTLHADALLSITPFLIDEELLLFSAKRLGLPMAASILSFDNLTTKDRIPVLLDLYCVWNKHNAQEITRFYPYAKNSKIIITGAPQFDFYWRKNLLLPRQEWLQLIGAPDDRPIILFGGGPDWIAPNEPHWLKQIDRAISSGEIQGHPFLLFRKHPLDSEDRWDFLSKSSNILLDKSWDARNMDGRSTYKLLDTQRLTASLCHTAVHVNAASTMTVDGSAFDRPQIGPAYDDQPGHKYDRISYDSYLREHYLPITKSGGLAIARSRDEMIQSINDALRFPEKRAAGRIKILEEIITFTDGQSTQRVVKAVEGWLLGS